MDNLQVFTKDEFVKVDFDKQTLSARDLHEKLNIGTKFATWFPRMTEYGFAEGIDYKTCYPNLGSENHGGQNMVDYDITVDMAKQICMIQRTPEGKRCRQYLIDLEKAWNSPEHIMARALKMANAAIENLKSQNYLLIEDVKRMKPKEEFFDAVADSKDAIEIGKVAKVLNFPGVGRNKLFEILRRKGILMKDNIPYQKFIDNGCFRTIEQKYSLPDGETRISIKTLVYQKGVDYIRKVLETA